MKQFEEFCIQRKPPSVININRSIDFSYFLVDSKNEIKLYTVEWFSESKCLSPKFVIVDRFIKTLNLWKNSLKFQEKFKNFNNCTLGAQVIKEKGSADFDRSNKLKGFIIDLSTAIAQKGNFSINFQLRDIFENRNNKTLPRQNFGFYYLETNTMYIHKFNHITSTFSENKHIFVVTPNEKYTNWEKVMLPFDADTWKYLGVTFSLAFLMVIIVKFLPDFIRILIYGEGVRHPAFNILGTFFGIGQLKLPMGNFARILLIFFIIFCLVIRTAYQGKFDFNVHFLKIVKPFFKK